MLVRAIYSITIFTFGILDWPTQGTKEVLHREFSNTILVNPEKPKY